MRIFSTLGCLVNPLPSTGRSSPPEVFLKKGVLKICNKHTVNLLNSFRMTAIRAMEITIVRSDNHSITFFFDAFPFMSRSIPSKVLLGKGVLKICSKFTGEHLCRSLDRKDIIAEALFKRSSLQ